MLVNGVDVTSDLSGDITLDLSPGVVSSLSFTLSGKNFWVPGERPPSGETASPKDVVKLFDKVYFEGGAGIGSSNYSSLFLGSVIRLQPEYTSQGRLKVRIEAADYSYRSAYATNYYAYPGKNQDRSWANGSTIRASKIIYKLAEESGLQIGKDQYGNEDVKLAVDLEFTLKSPLVQKNKTDWTILRQLAKRLNCSFWTTQENGQLYLHFVDKSFLRDGSNRGGFGFLYALRENSGKFVYPSLNPGEQAIWNVYVDHDFSQISAATRVIPFFDYGRGETVNVFEATITEDGKKVTKYFTFEIDEAKVRSLPPAQRREIENISYQIAGGDSGYDISDIAKYFKPAKFYSDRRVLTVDEPYFGIRITATTDGNVNIIPRRNYPVRGIGRYGSDNLEDNYYLRSVKHTFGSEGFLTEMEFIK